ncbi:hypothetical protein K488DRAFT_74525 [Vararia minispora EC-137]|uniref:Uncharacterized protein n=1 Tax=Vararia minispora EC-137 TaxID=1314806 RepID=A0ACB8Q6N5_9AGAM|nr:hypothetical protein K488DRAFT_74525 [Vararia minispora EC-137]
MKPTFVLVSLLLAAQVFTLHPLRYSNPGARAHTPAGDVSSNPDQASTNGEIGSVVSELGTAAAAAAAGAATVTAQASGQTGGQAGGQCGQGLAIVNDWVAFGHWLASGPVWTKVPGNTCWGLLTLVLVAFTYSFYGKLRMIFDAMFGISGEDKKKD